MAAGIGIDKVTPERGSLDLRNYMMVTGAYWAQTVADGGTRVLVLFYFYELGYVACLWAAVLSVLVAGALSRLLPGRPAGTGR